MAIQWPKVTRPPQEWIPYYTKYSISLKAREQVKLKQCIWGGSRRSQDVRYYVKRSLLKDSGSAPSSYMSLTLVALTPWL